MKVELAPVPCPVCRGVLDIEHGMKKFAIARCKLYVFSIQCKHHGSQVRVRSIKPAYLRWGLREDPGFLDKVALELRKAVRSPVLGALIEDKNSPQAAQVP